MITLTYGGLIIFCYLGLENCSQGQGLNPQPLISVHSRIPMTSWPGHFPYNYIYYKKSDRQCPFQNKRFSETELFI